MELKECKTPWERLKVLVKYFDYLSLISPVNNFYVDGEIMKYNIFDKSSVQSYTCYCAICLTKVKSFKTDYFIYQKKKLILYAKCSSCEKHSICKNCLHPSTICTSAKITTILCLRHHIHRNIIPIIITRI